jgi:hypothetical protein
MQKQLENLLLILKGFILGIANIIPGVSGGTLAMTMGIYEDIIKSISSILKTPKKSLKLLLYLGIGAALSILILSKLLNYTLTNYAFATTLFFIGLIVGGFPLLLKKAKGHKVSLGYLLSFLSTTSLVIILRLLQTSENTVSLNNISLFTMIILLLVGMLAASTMVIPGVSGSFVLMLIGFYKPILNTISNITKFNLLGHNLLILVPFGIGVLLGIVLTAKLIEYLLKKYEIYTYYGIYGFILASILVLILNVYNKATGIPEVVVGILLVLLGTFIGYKLGE